MTTSTKELIEDLTRLGNAWRNPRLSLAADRLRELQEELDGYCPRPVNGQTDHSSAGCINRGECGCDIRCRVKEST